MLYEDGQMLDLNTLIDPASGWYLTEAAAINDRGQIAATGYSNGRQHALLLTPTAVPEPSSLVLLGLGIGLGAGAVARSRALERRGLTRT